MTIVTMREARTHLSRLVDAVERVVETEIIITRNGRPVAKLVAIDAAPKPQVRLGLQAGKYPSVSLEECNADDKEFERLFYDDED